MNNKHTITLERDDAVDLIALLINYSAIIEAFYENIEPTASVVDRINKDIMYQLLEDNLHLTDVELTERTARLARSLSGLNL